MAGQTIDPALVARIEASFAKQAMMTTLGARLVRVAPGEVEIAMPASPHLSQQHGFVHAGAVATIADSAAGYAGLTTMPAGNGILTAEFKINYTRPARGERLVARARVASAGKRLAVCTCEIVALADGEETVVAIAQGSIARIEAGKD